MKGVVIPDGWTWTQTGLTEVFVLEHPDRLMATVDFGGRSVRTGWSTCGPTFFRDPVRMSGRGWRQKLVDIAVAYLVGIAK